MSGPKLRLDLIDRNKKQKTVTHLWRPVSTQSNSVQESADVCSSVSSSISNSQQEAITEVTDKTISSSSLGDNVQGRALNEESMLSVEKHSLTIQVDASLIRFIKGKRGSTQQKIEEEMGVKVIIPSSKKEETTIIEGSSIDSVTRASEKIQAIIDEAVKSPSLDYSHFISLPLAIHPELVDKLFNFQNTILGEADASLVQTMESDSNEDTSDDENKDQQSSKENGVAVELKVEDDRHVKVDLTSIPLVSYAPKASKSPTLSGRAL